MKALLAIIHRDLLLVMRRKSEVLTALFFFVVVTSLFPLGIGADAALLRKIAPGVLWVAALLSTLPGFHRMFAHRPRLGTRAGFHRAAFAGGLSGSMAQSRQGQCQSCGALRDQTQMH